MPDGPMMISGFTIARNVIDLGYPLIEAVCSALPICDEFVISEGYSSDRTWETVRALADRFPEKIRVRRDRWSDIPDNGEIIAQVSNLALADCRSKYCLYLQANEVLQENSLRLLSSLPRRHPGTVLFSIPVFSLLGRDLLWLVQQRNRLFTRDPGIVITGDGYDAGCSRGKTLPESLSYRIHRRWQRLKLWRGDTSHGIFRYRALYPANYLHKIEIRRAMTRDGAYRKQWDQEWKAANHAASLAGGDPRQFWNLMTPFFNRRCAEQDDLDVRGKKSRVAPFETRGPKIMDSLGETWEFSLEQSLKWLDTLP